MWIKKDKTNFNEINQNKTFRRRLIVLLDNITIHCYRHLVQPNRSLWEIFMWIIIHVTNTCILLFFIMSGWDEFTTKPLITILHNTLYPIQEVPFPAVAICSNNRISKKVAESFAKELYMRDPDLTRNLSFFIENIKFLGKLYDFDMENEHSFSVFQAVLEDYYADNNTDIFSVPELMDRLAPSCSDILLRCFWRSIEIPCSAKDGLMTEHNTQYGKCCTFNYIFRDDQNAKISSQLYLDLTGPDMGLIVLAFGDPNDYFYPIFNSIGFNIQIFNPNEFTDAPSGGVSERFIQLGTETFLRIDAVTVQTVRDVKRYSLETRNCLFRDEMTNKYTGQYERSNCVINCRIRSIVALCDCIPFFLPTINYNQKLQKSFVICNLQHIPCLNKYKVKWLTLITKIIDIVGLEKEMEESLYCPDCLPSCSDVTYLVTSTSLPLVKPQRQNFNLITEEHNVSDIGIIRVFFGQPETWLYKQDVALLWYEILSNFGGMVGIMSGFSLVSGVEIIYFIIKEIYRQIKNHIHINKNNVEPILIYP